MMARFIASLTIFRVTNTKLSKMTMWADNIKFVKDIIDGKYQKIDAAAAEVSTQDKKKDLLM